MFTIELNNLVFTAKHGVHAEEKLLGNTYEISVSLSTNVVETVTELSQTVNYVTVYDIIRQRMEVPSALLETVAQELAVAICALDERIRSITVSIRKKYPPMLGIDGSVGVSYKKDI